MKDTDDIVLNTKQTAEFLGLCVNSAIIGFRTKEIPGTKVRMKYNQKQI